MKQDQNAKSEAKRAALLSAVLAVALLFLAVVLAKSAVTQLRGGHPISGCVSILGTLLFFLVGLLMLNDLRKRLQAQKTQQEDHHE